MSTDFDHGISYTNIHIFTEAQNVNAFATSVDGRQLTCADDPQTPLSEPQKEARRLLSLSLPPEISQGTATVSSRSLCVTCILGAYKPLKFTSVAEVSLPSRRFTQIRPPQVHAARWLSNQRLALS